jgi:hypothetical protein
MAKIKEDIIRDIDDLKKRFELMKDDFESHFNISGISHIELIDDLLYLYFIKKDGSISDRINYKFIKNGIPIDGDHVVKGLSLNEIYRDLEFVTVNYVFGIIC